MEQADDVVDIITRSFASFLNVKPPPQPASKPPTASVTQPASPRLASTKSSIAETEDPKGKGKGKARALPQDASADEPPVDSGLGSATVDPDFRFGAATSTSTLPWEQGSGSSSRYNKGELVFCKSQVFVHPSKKRDDNIPGYLGLASVKLEDQTQGRSEQGHQDDRDQSVKAGPTTMVLFWVPASVVEGLDEEDGYLKVSERADKILQQRAGVADSNSEKAHSESEGDRDEDEGQSELMREDVIIETDLFVLRLLSWQQAMSS
jgi:hypothetical protein